MAACKSGFKLHLAGGQPVAELFFSCSLRLDALDDLRTPESLSVNIESPNPIGMESNHPDSDSGSSVARLADFGLMDIAFPVEEPLDPPLLPLSGVVFPLPTSAF
uniref:Uncharacterized protein n=1 Tax=Lotus japonicus TaxID=34305 RepID=I3SBS1_LOTJA|nr:unknown [Lotus japonicus]